MTNYWLDTKLRVIVVNPKFPCIIFEIINSDFELKNDVYIYLDKDGNSLGVFKEDHIKIQKAFAQRLKEVILDRS
ncbi:MAG: hypothetical protein DWQ19_12265 [Crenarchaeota archaeon]|nr:MAG: hypothetical protein DWQ19_12265 [Thermoproteota archaeon]